MLVGGCGHHDGRSVALADVLVAVLVVVGGSGSGGSGGTRGCQRRTETGSLSLAAPRVAVTGIVTSRMIRPSTELDDHRNSGSTLNQTWPTSDSPGANSAAHRIRRGATDMTSHSNGIPIATTPSGSSATASARPVLDPVLRTSISTRPSSHDAWPWAEASTSTPSTGVGASTRTGTVGSRSRISAPALMLAAISPPVAGASACMR